MANMEDIHGDGDIPEVTDPLNALDLPWFYMLDIKKVIGLTIPCQSMYCEYAFNGETITTDVFEFENTSLDELRKKSLSYPAVWNYIHSKDKIDVGFLQYLLTSNATLNIFVKPYVPTGLVAISSKDRVVAENFGVQSSLEDECSAENTDAMLEFSKIYGVIANAMKKREKFAKVIIAEDPICLASAIRMLNTLHPNWSFTSSDNELTISGWETGNTNPQRPPVNISRNQNQKSYTQEAGEVLGGKTGKKSEEEIKGKSKTGVSWRNRIKTAKRT